MDQIPEIDQKKALATRIDELVKQSHTGKQNLFQPSDQLIESLAQKFPAAIKEKLSYHYLKIAREKFQTLLNNRGDTIITEVVVKNYIAVLNSLADLSIRKYEISACTDITLIETARAFIDEIKQLFDSIRLIYDHYPTYSATEFG